MSDAKNQQAEPSMEEILASIRRIISEDGDAGKTPPAAPAAAAPAAAPPPAAAPAPTPAPAPEPPKAAPAPPPPAEVLELTEMVGEDGKVTKIEEKSEPPPEPPAPPPAPPAAPEPVEASDGEDLISTQTAAAAMGALAGLQAATKKSEVDVRGPMPIGNGAATLEEIVRSEMRPILKAWLDENLPGLVERLVQKEIKRITRQVEET